MSPRIVARPIAAVFSIASILGAGIMLHACAQTAASTAAAPTVPAPMAAAPSPVAAPLDLCRPPNLAPADLRDKPGYTQFRVTVTEANGAPIRGLGKSDFTVRVGQKSFPIAYFRERSNSDTPVSIVSVADESKTMLAKVMVTHGDLPKTRAAIAKAGDTLNECTELALITVGGTNTQNGPTLAPVTYLQPFTTEKPVALARTFLVKPSGEQRLPDAIRMGLTAIEDAHYADRALVVSTDGLDQKAIAESENILRAAPHNGFSFWVIGIGDPDASSALLRRDPRVDVAAIKRLATAGGGQALFAKPVEDDNGSSLAQAITEIGDQAAAGYSIGVVLPGDTAGPSIVAANHPGAIVKQDVVARPLLSALASLPVPVSREQCKQIPQVPAAVSSQPGFSLLTVSVIGVDGKPATGLMQSDFAASCGGTDCPIVYFQRFGDNDPKAVVIAIDSSASMGPKIETVKREVGKLIDSLGVCDQLALLAFNNRPYLLKELTLNHRSAKSRMAILHAYGQTAVYDALGASIQILAKSPLQRRAVVLVTDGFDTLGGRKKDSMLADLRRSGIPVYVIGITAPDASTNGSNSIGPFTLSALSSGGVDKAPLEEIAQASGAQVYLVAPLSSDQGRTFEAAMKDIGGRIATGYEIGIATTSGGPIAVLSIPSHPDLKLDLSEKAPGGG